MHLASTQHKTGTGTCPPSDQSTVAVRFGVGGGRTRPFLMEELRSFRRWCSAGGVSAVILLATAVPLSAQDTLTVSGVVQCDDCAITLDTVVTIGGLDGPTMISGLCGPIDSPATWGTAS